MAKGAKKPAKALEPDRGLNQLEVVLRPGKTEDQAMAEYATGGVASGAHIVKMMGHGPFGELSLNECTKALRNAICEVQKGDLAGMEAMLVSQAAALGSIFHECTRRAFLNMAQYPEAMERYMRLALKAQSQARCTIETLAEIKQPRSVAFVRQANIANGHQQINNGAEALAGESEIRPNELFEVIHGEPLDARGTGKAGRGNPPLEAVGAVHRSAQRRRKGSRQP